MRDIKERFEHVIISATLKCAANRKIEYDKIRFIDQGKQPNNKFYSGAIGTALWKGVRLRDVLLMA